MIGQSASVEVDVPSSYARNGLGRALYDQIVRLDPVRVVEFGVLYGYSTIWMARGLRRGRIRAYDLWQRYPHRSTTMAVAQQNLERYGVADAVDLRSGDFGEWAENPEPFDVLHLDISNDGDALITLVDAVADQIENGAVVLFEGGTPERDQEGWMVSDSRRPMFPLKDELGYTIVDQRWPGLSMIDRTTLRNRPVA